MDPSALYEQSTVCLAETSLLSPPPDSASSPAPSTSQDDKKSVKKRKSWGQELPTPKTNLPPRKRAKTEDEKEQRRIERVLRNRQAAQSSRERKRQEVEKLEEQRDNINSENHRLRQRLMAIEDDREALRLQLAEMRDTLRKNNIRVSSPPPPPASPMLNASMFTEKPLKTEPDTLPSLFEQSRSDTVDPRTSLTPAPQEVVGESESLDLVQHPAVPVQCTDFSDFNNGASRRNSVVSAATPASSVSDGTFNNLFDVDDTVLPAPSFFEEGFGATSGDADANNVHPDYVADLDSNFSTQAFDDALAFDGDSQHDEFPFDFSVSNETILDFSDQSATTSSHLQPCIGASS